MNSLNRPTTNLIHSEDSEIIRIELWKIFSFFRQQYKRLIFGAFVGAIAALFWSLSFGVYKGQVEIYGNWGDFNQDDIGTSLSAIAQTLSNNPELDAEQKLLYKNYSNARWWNDVISLAPRSVKQLSLPGTKEVKYETLLVSIADKDPALLERQALRTSEFVSNSYSTIGIRKLLNEYEFENMKASAQIEKSLNDLRLKLSVANRKLANLEGLQKYSSQTNFTLIQTTEPKHSMAKYFPIDIQIIGIKSDIFSFKEEATQLKIKKDQAKLIRYFLEQCKQILSSDITGLKMIEQLLAVESQLRSDTSVKDGEVLLSALDHVRLDLLTMQFGLLKNQIQPMTLLIHRIPSLTVSFVRGLLGGLLTALLICGGLHAKAVLLEKK